MAEQESAFLNFLLQTNKSQIKALLSHATLSQIQALIEVAYNARFSSLDQDLVNNLKPYKHLIRKLTDDKLSTTQRRRLVSRRAQSIFNIVHLMKDRLP